jgi:hypothetical protein
MHIVHCFNVNALSLVKYRVYYSLESDSFITI